MCFLSPRRVRGVFTGSRLLSSLLLSRTYLPPVLKPLFRPEGKLRYEAEDLLKERFLRTLADNFKRFSVSPWFRRRVDFYSETVRRLTIAKRFSLIEEILEDQKKFWNIAEEGFASRIIILYGRAGMLDHAQRLFDELPRLNSERTTRSFNALLSACLSARNHDKFMEVFRKVPPMLSIKPNLISYTSYVKALCDVGDLDAAVSAVDDMEWNGFDPNVITYAILLEGFYRNGKFSDADGVWETLEKKGIAPIVRCYNAKMETLVGQKKVSEAVEVFQGLDPKGVKPDGYTFRFLIEGFCEGKDFGEAKSWYRALEEKQCNKQEEIFWKLVPLALEMNDVGFALQVSHAAIRQWCTLDPVVLQALVDGLVKESMEEEANKLVRFLKKTDGFYHSELELPPPPEPQESSEE